MPEKPLHHGRDHRGGGEDPIQSDWVYVGDATDPNSPPFQNGWDNSGGTYAPMRFRILPHADFASLTPGGPGLSIEIQGSVSGGTAHSVVFTLPLALDYDLHLAASDDSGSFVVFTVQQSGDVVHGFV